MRRVRYPLSAVLRAVSAKPLRAPWVEMKYSSTLSPSRKLDFTGTSIKRPLGSDMRPRIPAIWVIWLMFPFAPELAMRATPPKVDSASSIRVLIFSLASVQILMVWSCRSSSFTSPPW